MNKQQLLFLLQAKAVMETVKLSSYGVPESQVYLALNMNFEQSSNIVCFLKDKKAIKVNRNLITAGEDFDGFYEILEKIEQKVKSLSGGVK